MISPCRLCESIHLCEHGVRSVHELAERHRRVWAWICPHPVRQALRPEGLKPPRKGVSLKGRHLRTVGCRLTPKGGPAICDRPQVQGELTHCSLHDSYPCCVPHWPQRASLVLEGLCPTHGRSLVRFAPGRRKKVALSTRNESRSFSGTQQARSRCCACRKSISDIVMM
jgi:hypothetical protein